MRIEDALHTFVNYQNTQHSNFYQRVEDSSKREPFHLIGCHHAGKSRLVYWTCKQRNLLYCHVSQDTYPDVFRQDDPDDFINHLLDVVIREEAVAWQVGAALPVPFQNRDTTIFTRYLNKILAKQSVVFVFSFRNSKKTIYQNIDTWLRDALSRVVDTQQHKIHLVYTAWSYAKPFGNVSSQGSRFTGPVQEKPISDTSNIALPSDSGSGSEHILYPVTSDKAYEIFCAALYPQSPEFTSEILAEWCGGHLGSILFLAKAVDNHWDETNPSLPISERIKNCIRSHDPNGVFSSNLRDSLGYDLKTRKIPDGICPKDYGICTQNDRYIRLLEYQAQPPWDEKIRRFTVQIHKPDSRVSGTVIKLQEHWFVLTCDHCVPQEEVVQVLTFDNQCDVAYVVHRTNQLETINDMALLALKPGEVVDYFVNLTYSPPALCDLKPQENDSCYSFGYGTTTFNDEVRHTTWGKDAKGGFQAVNMPVVPGDSGSPVWYWDKFDLAIAGMIVLQVGEEARAIPAGKLYEYVQSVLQDASLIERLNNWRNQ